jgi:hypothetical protein
METTPRKPAISPERSSPPNEIEFPGRWSVQRKSELVSTIEGGGGRYVGIPLACPRKPERYTAS